jgi:hypothetical protein
MRSSVAPPLSENARDFARSEWNEIQVRILSDHVPVGGACAPPAIVRLHAYRGAVPVPPV